MSGKQAKILTTDQIANLLAFATHHTRCPIRNRLIVLLSVKAGLRAGEISHLTWDMVLDASGTVGSMIELHDDAAKKGSGRRIPVHGELRTALMEWRDQAGSSDAVITSERGNAMTPKGVVNWFALAYRAIGFAGCSSHSGRRTFITRAARLVHKAGGS
jgi:integrase